MHCVPRRSADGSVHLTAVERAVELSYGRLIPSDAKSALNKCQRAIGKAAATFALVQAKSVQKCWDLRLAGKHAGDSSTVTVRVWEDAGALLFEVADSGAGFAPSARSAPGAGFVNMGDRVGAIGGTFGVQSAPGRGTRVSGRIPIQVSQT